jgi:hypothetical protein
MAGIIDVRVTLRLNGMASIRLRWAPCTRPANRYEASHTAERLFSLHFSVGHEVQTVGESDVLTAAGGQGHSL